MRKIMVRFLIDMVWGDEMEGKFGALKAEALRVERGEIMIFKTVDGELDFEHCWLNGNYIVSPISSMKHITGALGQNIINVFEMNEECCNAFETMKNAAEKITECGETLDCSDSVECGFCKSKARITLKLIEGFGGTPKELEEKAKREAEIFQKGIDKIKEGRLHYRALAKAAISRYGLDEGILEKALRTRRKELE